MQFPVPAASSRDTDQVKRDEEKRATSPCSFFFAQSQALLKAVEYLNNDANYSGGYKGVLRKHLDRANLALFAQLMAAFEYLLKDFIARAIDCTDLFDDALRKRAKKREWPTPDIDSVLSQRYGANTPGRLLVHGTLGWYDHDEVNQRYNLIFGNDLYEDGQRSTMARLWQIRHSISHNAGYCTHSDALQLDPALTGTMLEISPDFFREAVRFLRAVAKRMAEELGEGLLQRWFKTRATGDFDTDRDSYRSLRLLATYVDSRPKNLPKVGKRDYNRDRKAYFDEQ